MPPRRQDLLQGIVAAATDQAERSAPEPALSAVPERILPAAEPVPAAIEPPASPVPEPVAEAAAPTPEELLAQLDKPVDEHDDLVQLAFRVRASKRDEIKRACLDLGLNIQDFGRLSVDLLLAEVRPEVADVQRACISRPQRTAGLHNRAVVHSTCTLSADPPSDSLSAARAAPATVADVHRSDPDLATVQVRCTALEPLGKHV